MLFFRETVATEKDRQEVIPVIIDWTKDTADSITNKIVSKLQQIFGSTTEVFREQIGGFVNSIWMEIQSGQEPTKPELAIPFPPKSKDKDHVPQSHSQNIPAPLPTQNNRALTEAQIAAYNAQIAYQNARTEVIKAETRATIADTNAINARTRATIEKNTSVATQRQANENRWTLVWREKLKQVPPDQQEAVITQAAKEYFKLTGEKINVKNPNPSNVGLWSDSLGKIIINNQIYGQPTSAITPAAPPPKLGGFGEGPQADVRNNTTYARTESLPPLGGFGEGPQPQIPSHTGHPPTVSGIPEKLEGFGAGPQADTTHVLKISNEQLNNIHKITQKWNRRTGTNCDKCAAELEGYLREQGIPGKHIRVETTSNRGVAGIIYDDLAGKQIANNGYHEGISIEINGVEIVFDDVHSEGLPRDQWLQNLVISPVPGNRLNIVRDEQI
ncbi:papain fold toxin domain-containing protein [Cylindrospermum stagnale]|nr:papain fold toxin domain-containing protein [Cylindrospermum stagnale]